MQGQCLREKHLEAGVRSVSRDVKNQDRDPKLLVTKSSGFTASPIGPSELGAKTGAPTAEFPDAPQTRLRVAKSWIPTYLLLFVTVSKHFIRSKTCDFPIL